MKRNFSFDQYHYSEKIGGQIFPLAVLPRAAKLSVLKWDKTEKNGAAYHELVFRIEESTPQPSGISLIFEEEGWSAENYVFAPAALYNGNRFDCVEREYPPMLTRDECEKYAGETVIADVPRLEKRGNGKASLEVGDLSTPCIGYFCRERKKGFFLFFAQRNELGNFGITVRENADEKTARFILSSPCVREKFTYGMATTGKKSTDTGARLKKGDTVTFRFTEYTFDCESISDFHDHFFKYRGEQALPARHPDTVPWSYAWGVIEEKYNRRNWVDNPGFYKSSEASSSIYRQWQTGWVGGAMNTLPALALGNGESAEKSRRTLDFIFHTLQHPSGFLYGVYCDGKAYGDDFHNPENANIVMSRKNADALYYLIKQLMLLKKTGGEIKALWQDGVHRLADAFFAFYRKNGDLGQFIDMENGGILAGKTTSAGIAPAGLVLCGKYFGNREYISAAGEIAEAYYNNYVAAGYTNGGPGEILSAPDSESAFGLLESYTVLYAHTAEAKWLHYARDTASLCAGWCVSYDYAYNKNTQLYRRGVSTTGAVWANVQNKHAAPGICTLSGSSLLRLYRATGDRRYLELLRDISHCITQFVSIPENPLYASYVWHEKKAEVQKKLTAVLARLSLARSKKMSAPLPALFNPVGRINERVNLSDWEGKNNVGEVPHGSCWCEVSAMLTYLEIPAVYVQTDTLFCFALDHVKCCVESSTEKELVISLENPTPYDARYRLLIEKSADCGNSLDDTFYTSFQTVSVRAGENKKLRLERE